MKISLNFKKISTFLLAGFFVVFCVFFGYAHAAIFDFQRIDPKFINITADNYSGNPSISGDSRYILFDSDATNLVANDTNGSLDIFLYDTQTESVSIISVDSLGGQGNGNSSGPNMTPDGRYISFYSDSTNLVVDDTNGVADIFLHDTQTGTTTRISLDSLGNEGDVDANNASISSDGRYITFVSNATNLVVGDTNTLPDVFLHDTQTGVTTRVSVDSLGNEGDFGAQGIPRISADGRYIAFTSESTNLVVGDTNTLPDVFLHDTQTGVTTRVSVDSLGNEGDGYSGPLGISSNGRYIGFTSESTNLVVGDTNGTTDIFLHDTQTGVTTRVSVDSLGNESLQGGTGGTMSADGRYFVFESSSDFDINDTNGNYDVFLHDTQTGDTIRVSRNMGIVGNSFSYTSNFLNVSIDGRYVAFSSSASNFITGDNNNTQDIFLYDTQTSELELISKNYDPQTVTFQSNADSYTSKVSGDGRYIVFESEASNFVSNDTNGTTDIFLHDTQTGATTRVSVDSLGGEGNDLTRYGEISYDGRYIAFGSFASNFVTGDTNGEPDVFLHDTQTGITTRVSVDSLGNEGNLGAPLSNIRISADGRYVVFDSFATNLVVGDTNGVYESFLHDTQTGITSRVALDSLGNQANDASLTSSISADGRYVAFSSQATNLVVGDTNGVRDVFVRDTQTGVTIRASVDSFGNESDGESGAAAVSDDNRYIVFESDATNLVAGDANGETDLFLYDTQTDITTRISNGLGIGTMFYYNEPSITSDNRYVSYANHIFDLQTGSDSVVTSNPSDLIWLSDNGQVMTFLSSQPNGLVDSNGFTDVFYSPITYVSLSYLGDFIESASNNGSVTGSRVVTITNDTFTHAGSTLTLNTDYTLTNVPTGLTPVMTVNGGGTTATLTFTGNATSHANANDVSTLTITFLDPAFTLEQNAVSVTNYTDALGVINFQDSSGGGGSGPSPVLGCTDSDADNYNPAANQDNDSCLYVPGAITGCTDVSAGNYNASATVDNGSCLYGVFGCTDVTAVNYNPLAQYNNNTCQYGPPIDPPDPNEINGCMDPGALNYDPLATVNSVPCDYLIPVINGCTDVSAENYNIDATNDDGSCAYKNPPGGGGGLPGVISTITKAVTSFVKHHPEVPLTVSILGLLIPFISNFISPGNLAGLISIPIRIWNIIPTLLGFRRKKRPWGTVYDSITKQPLDPVYVMLKTKSGKEIATSITDLDGRYGFQVEPGEYSLFANKANYIFPSVKLVGKTKDELYDNLYFGEGIQINNEDEIINKNIPMDAINFNWNEFEKAKNKKLMKFYSKTELFLARISKILFIAGFISSIILASVDPSTFNVIILSLYILILILAFFGVKPRAFGFVNEKGTGYPLSFGIISVFSSELGKEVAHSVIGKTGKYYLLVPKGKYFVRLRKKTGEETYEDIYESEAFTANKGYINKVIKV